MKEYPWGKGTPKWVRDATADDSDKSFTVPAGKIWNVLDIQAQLTTTATVGNRLLTCVVTDGTNIVHPFERTAALAASKTGGLNIYSGNGLNTAAADTTYRRVKLSGGTALCDQSVSESIPCPFVLLAGYVVRIWDAAAIDAAADDLTVILHYVEYDA